MSGLFSEPGVDNAWQAEHAIRLLRSYRRLRGQDLLPETPDLAHAVYHAPFAVLTHDDAEDRIFTYANLTAQRLFEMPWAKIVGLPSRYSAEPMARDERQRLLERVARDGYIDDYQGVRISSAGRRFRIRRATVWNIADAEGRVIGQGATFANWEPLGNSTDNVGA